MIKLLSTEDRARLVCSSDPSVSSDLDAVIWLDASNTEHKPDALIVEVRPLNSREFLRLQGEVQQSPSPEIELVVRAAEVGICTVEAEGKTTTDAADLRVWLDKFPPAELSALGAYVINITLIGEDERPT
jgi:hypothetical protein